MTFIYPDLDWYTKIIEQEKIPLRCPYANVHRCYRYYASLDMLGKADVTTKMKVEKIKELDEFWNKSELQPVIAEHDTGFTKANDKLSSLSNFCPEVTFDIIGLFASLLIMHSDEDVQQTVYEQVKKDSYPKDWRLDWAHVEPLHYFKCPVYFQLITRPIEKDTGTSIDQINIMTNDSSIVRKTESAIDDLVDLWKRRKLVFIFVFLIIIVPTLFSVYQTYYKIPELEKENTDKTAEIQRLETLLVPFKTLALERYTGSEQEVLQKFTRELQALKNTTDQIAAQPFYRPLIIEKKKIVKNKLSNLMKELGDTPLDISLSFLQGSRNRSLVAIDIYNMLKETGFNVNKPASSMIFSKSALPAISVKYHPDTRELAKKLILSFNGYLNTQVTGKTRGKN